MPSYTRAMLNPTRLAPLPPDHDTRQSTVASPCVRVCCLDDHDICLGCGRSLDEIRGWYRAPGPERELVLQRARARLAGNAAQPPALLARASSQVPNSSGAKGGANR